MLHHNNSSSRRFCRINKRGSRRILITGGCGFVGRYLTSAFLAAGDKVLVLDDLSTGLMIELPAHDNLSFIYGDVLNPDVISRAGKDVDLVIHLASLVGMKLADRNYNRAYDVSLRGSWNVLKNTGDVPVVLISSSSVYGLNHADKPMSEALPIPRKTALEYDGYVEGYATGKWEVERLGREASRAGRDVMILRPFNIVGSGQLHEYGMVLPSFIKRALESLPLVIYDDGKQTRSFGDIETFVDTFMRLLDAEDAWITGQNVVNVGTTECTTILKLAQEVFNHVATSEKLEFVPYSSVFSGRSDTRGRIPDTEYLQRLVGPVHWRSIGEIVRDCVANELRQYGNISAHVHSLPMDGMLMPQEGLQ